MHGSAGRKVIFLDIDGVLNSDTFCDEYLEEHGVDPVFEDILSKKMIAYLKQIVQKSGADIVLSSTWREIESAREAVIEQLAAFGMSISDCTPDSRREWSRGDEIMAWIAEHPEVSRVLILDDTSVNDIPELQPHQVLTTWKWGLTSDHVPMALTILEKPWKNGRR